LKVSDTLVADNGTQNKNGFLGLGLGIDPDPDPKLKNPKIKKKSQTQNPKTQYI